MDSAYTTIEPKRDVPLFIFGDHASRRIPDDLNNLGLEGDDLTRHIAWDIGTDVIVRDLTAHFGCAAQIANISRLVIDLNRDVRMPSSIPVESDGTLIPGNRAISADERRARIERYHTPYHTSLSHTLEGYDDPLVISVHSFTPKPDLGEFRDVDIGLLVKHDERSADLFAAELRRAYPDYRVGINEPYSAHILNYTIDTTVAARGLRHLAIEVNQSLCDTDARASVIATELAQCLEPLISGAQNNEGLRHAG